MNISIKEIKKEQAWELRHRVMWPEKEIDFIKLDDDDIGIHYGLFKESKLISTISLFIEGDSAQFRKFATVQDEQGKGYGSKLLEHIMKEAKSNGVKHVWCNARENKKSFYKKFAMCATDRTFFKEGKNYIIMEHWC